MYLFGVAGLVSTLTGQPVIAGSVGYANYAAYQVVASGDEVSQDFDSLAPGALVSSIDAVTYQSSGPGLATHVTDGLSDDTVSPAIYIGTNQVLFRQLTNETITFSFDTPRSAVGVSDAAAGAKQRVLASQSMESNTTRNSRRILGQALPERTFVPAKMSYLANHIDLLNL